MPDPALSAALAAKIATLHSDLPVPMDYIEAALALARGDAGKATSIAESALNKMSATSQTASDALNRELLRRCRV